MPSNYTVSEERTIDRALRRDGRARCPRCSAWLQPRPVPRPPEVSYVRSRRWLICAGCKRSVVLDMDEER